MIIFHWDKNLSAPKNAFSKLLKAHAMSKELIRFLPETGFIFCDDREDPIAAGFLRKVEGRVGILDSYISNPKMDSQIRNEMLNRITERLIVKAKHFQMRQLFAWSLYPEIIKRACDHGFKQSAHGFAILNLNEENL